MQLELFSRIEVRCPICRAWCVPLSFSQSRQITPDKVFQISLIICCSAECAKIASDRVKEIRSAAWKENRWG